ncbi:MAG: glycosyltransferase family 4 protein [Candidatus Bathyarchaeia archaeon]
MKVLFIIAPFRLKEGASERIVYELIQRLSNMGIEVLVIQPGYRQNILQVDKGIKVYQYTSISFTGRSFENLLHYSFLWSNLNKLLKEIVDKERVDLIISSRFYNTLFIPQEILDRSPLIIYELNHYPWIDDPGFRLMPKLKYITSQLNRKLLLNIARITMKKAAAVIAVSGAIKTWILENVHIPQNKIYVVYNGVDTRRFSPLLRTENMKGRREKIVLHVGTDHVVVRKGLHYCIKIMKYLPDSVKLLVVGYRYTPPENRKYMEWIKGMISNYGLTNRVIFTGWVPEAELPVYFAESDVYLFPSLLEGFGLSVAEALASGKPVIGFDIPPINELVENQKEGILVPVGDVKALAEAVKSLLFNESLLAEMSYNARKKALEKFSWDRIVAEHLKIYERVLSRGS